MGEQIEGNALMTRALKSGASVTPTDLPAPQRAAVYLRVSTGRQAEGEVSIPSQRDLTTRSLSEVDARSQYVHARTNLDNVLGTVLKEHEVNIDEAKSGVVARPPDMVPVTAQPPANGSAAKRQ